MKDVPCPPFLPIFATRHSVDWMRIWRVSSPWDVAVAELIARETGALMGHVYRVPAAIPVALYGEEVVFATPRINEEQLHGLQAEHESP